MAIYYTSRELESRRLDEEAPILPEQMTAWFGTPYPQEVVHLMFSMLPENTIGELRAAVRALGRSRGLRR